MPLYEYRCECGNEAEVRLSFGEADQSQACGCGETMRRKMSVSSFVMRQTGSQMALDTLNGRRNGMPNKWWKAGAEEATAAGL